MKGLCARTKNFKSGVSHIKPIWNSWKIYFFPCSLTTSSILADDLLILLLKSTLFGKMSVPRDIEISMHSVPGGFPLRITQQKRWTFN